jgi:hypothetical protein
LAEVGNLWESYLTRSFHPRTAYVFVKDPIIDMIELFPYVFPSRKMVLLIRDGRDQIASYERAATALRQGFLPKIKRVKRRIAFATNIDFARYVRLWRDKARRVLAFRQRFRSDEGNWYHIFRYEDLESNRDGALARLFEFYGPKCNWQIIENAKSAKVVGSSFLGCGGLETAEKPNWNAVRRSSSFNPVGRWKSWSKLRKNIFKAIAGKELVALGYEQDDKWD